MARDTHFNFGENWEHYSQSVLSQESLESAIKSIQNLLQTQNLEEKSFLDVGCGSGLFSIAASELNASRIIGIDINPVCIDISNKNSERLIPNSSITFLKGSALDKVFLSQLGNFDVVYAWGSLHHTGSMWDSISMVSKQVKSDGLLVLSIYNKHFTSPLWKEIKRIYNFFPKIGKQLMTILFGVIIFIAKYLLTGRDPFEKERGMDFRYDVID